MKKIYLGLLILSVSFFTFYVVRGIVRKLEKKQVIEAKISRLPSFSFATLDDRLYNSLEIKTGPVLVVHFHPECEHCKYEIMEIIKSDIPTLFKHVVLISSANIDTVKKFILEFNYPDIKSITTLYDPLNEFEDIFGSGTVPSTYIYDKELNLLNIYHGEVKPESILKHIKSNEQD